MLPELNYLRGEGEEEEREEERRGNEEEPVGGARGRKLVWGGPFVLVTLLRGWI